VTASAMPKEMEGPTVADEVQMPRIESCEGTPSRACELNYGLRAFSGLFALVLINLFQRTRIENDSVKGK
jgi:hypothetical protein